MYRGFVGTFFSHFLSLLSSIWAITSISDSNLRRNELIWIRLSFLLIVLNSCLALVRYGNYTFGYKLRKLHIFTLNLSTIISFTILEVVLHSRYKSPEYLKFSPTLNIIPFISNICSKDYRTKIYLTDLFICFNSFIISVLSFLNDNYFSIALNLSYMFGYFIIGECGFLFDSELPSIDGYQYVTCFLNIFTVYTFSF